MPRYWDDPNGEETRYFTEQMQFVGTVLQRELLDREARRRACSRAKVIRDLIDVYYGLENGAHPDHQQ